MSRCHAHHVPRINTGSAATDRATRLNSTVIGATATSAAAARDAREPPSRPPMAPATGMVAMPSSAMGSREAAAVVPSTFRKGAVIHSCHGPKYGLTGWSWKVPVSAICQL